MFCNKIKKLKSILISLFLVIIAFFIFTGLTLTELATINTSVISTFEDGTTTGWDKNGNITLTATQETKNTGQYSMKVSGRTSSWNSANLNLTNKLTKSQKYNVSVFVYYDNSVNESETIKITCKKNITGQSTAYSLVAQSNVHKAQWTEIKGQYTLDYTGTLDYISFYVEATNPTLEYYIDDVGILPVAIQSNFEDGATTNWSTMGSISLSAVQGIANTGNYSMKVSGRTSGWNGPQMDLTNKLVDGQKYYISAYVYFVDGAATETIKMTMVSKSIGGSNSYTGLASQNVTNGQWVELKAPYTYPGNMENIAVYFESPNATLEFYVDDFYIYGINIKPITNPAGVIADNKFEDGSLGGWVGSGSNIQLSISSNMAHTGSNSLYISGRANTWESPHLTMMNKMAKDKIYNVSLWVAQDTGVTEQISMTMFKKFDATNSYESLVYKASVPSNTWVNLVKDYTLTYTGTLEDLYLYVESPNATLNFYIDDVLITEKNIPSIEKDIPSVWEAYQNDFSVGVAVSTSYLTGVGSELVKKHFNSITAENDMKPASIQPTEGNFNFTNSDKYIDFAQANNIKVRGHTLVWHSQAAEWMFVDADNNPVTREVLLERMKTHIQTVVGRYRGKIYAWDVVNEAIDPSQPNNLRNSKWLQIIGPDFIEKAFIYAHEADPEAKLYYNDYSTEDSAKRIAIYNMVKDLKDRGIPIDGIGMQGHINIDYPTVASIEETIKKFSELDVELQITELDMSIYNNSTANYGTAPEELLIKQAYKYKDLFKMLKKYNNRITNVTFWGLKDDISWLNKTDRKDFPLIFNADYKAKYAYWGIIDPTHLPVSINTLKSSAGTPGIDGIRDNLWDLTRNQPIINLDGEIVGEFHVLWDNSNLYLFLKAFDLIIDPQDTVEIYLDQNNEKSKILQADDRHYTITRSDNGGLISVLSNVDDGYIVEATIPLDATTPAIGQKIGFDLRINNAGVLTSWNDFSLAQNTDTSKYGIVLLQKTPNYTEIKKGTPVIDGLNDILWDNIVPIETLIPTQGTTGATGKFKLLWDENYVYVFGDITDPVLSDANSNAYEQDSIEFFIDQNNGKTAAYEDNDAQYRVNFNNVQSFGNNADTENFKTSTRITAGGYRVEAAIPLNIIKGSYGNVMGLDIQVNDDDGSGVRTGIRNWNDDTNAGWQNTEGYGVVRLVDGDPLIIVKDDRTVAIIAQGTHENGVVNAEVSESLFDEAIEALVDNEHGTIEIITPSDADISAVNLILPAQEFYIEKKFHHRHFHKHSFFHFKHGEINKPFSNISILTPIGNLYFDDDAFKHEIKKTSEKLQITIRFTDASILPDKYRKMINSEPLFEVKAAVDGRNIRSVLQEKDLKITYHYHFDNPKDSKLFKMAVILDNNHVDLIERVRYNSVTEEVAFLSKYFGKFVIIPLHKFCK